MTTPNEAADRLRRFIRFSDGDNEQWTDDLDAALATERQRTVDEITRLRGTLALIADGRGPAVQMAERALAAERQRTVEPGIEALRHLFFVMERLDKQAGPPYSDDHMVKVTAETWIDLVRPAVQQVRRILDCIASDENGAG